jgi:RNAse (barnase) inhibitor barstar
MAPFDLNLDDRRLDWVILRDGGIALYWRSEILADDVKWFEAKNYVIHSFDAAHWDSDEPMHEEFRRALNFPDWYGRNPNALHDCIQNDLVIPENGGLVLVFHHYDHFVRATRFPSRTGDTCGSGAEVTLDILAGAIRYHSLLGRRLLVLIQSDDPKVQFGLLGGITPIWNWREWLNKNRGL